MINLLCRTVGVVFRYRGVKLIDIILNRIAVLLLKLSPRRRINRSYNAVGKAAQGSLQIVGKVAGKVDPLVSQSKRTAGVPHIKHFLIPHINLFKLLAVYTYNGRVNNLKAVAGCKKRNTFGVGSSRNYSVCRDGGAFVVYAVALRVSGQGSKHKLSGFNVTPECAYLLNGVGEEAYAYNIKQAVAFLNAGAEGCVVSQRPH